MKGSVSSMRETFISVLRGGAAAFSCAFVLASCSAPASDSTPKAAATAAASATAEPVTEGTPKRLRALTQEQYLNTLAYVFGPDVQLNPNFPPAQRTEGLLALGTGRGGISSSQLELYQKAAVTVAQLVVDEDRRKFLLTCTPKDEQAADAACAGQFFSHVGRLMHRRPLTKVELAEYVDEAGKASTSLKDFYRGLAVSIEAMLISPDVLFVVESAEADPRNAGKQRLDGYSLATRLSLFLWNAAPDDELLRAAEKGELQTAKGRLRQIDRMLASPRLEKGMRAFFDDMFAFDSFAALAKDAQMYPVFTGVTATDAREETLRVAVDHLITKNRDYRDLYTTRETFISPRLAAVYKLPATPTWSRYTFPEGSPRAGILTHVSFLAVHSHPVRSSPTMRGKALRELLLCQPVPPPPANVDFSALENPKATLKTTRDRVNFHLENPVCAGCHKITDPMGLALENFDGIGAYRETEKGQKIDASGALDGKPFTDAVGLGKALRDHPALPSCLVKRAFAYGSGSPTTNADRPLLAYFTAKFGEEGYKLPALLRTITMSDAFITISQPQAPASEKTAYVPSASAVAANTK
ncbi:MAG: DUF1592 domain-containing protein [Rhodospirillaceae bacterium]